MTVSEHELAGSPAAPAEVGDPPGPQPTWELARYGAPAETRSAKPERVSLAPESEAGRKALAWFLDAGRSLGYAMLGIVAFVLLWQLGAAMAKDLPSPGETASALNTLLSDPFYNTPNDKGILRYLGLSLFRVFVSFALAAAVGIPLGLLIGASERAWKAFNPVIQILRPVSPLAWFPLWLAATRSGPTAVYVVIFITALWPTLINTAAGAAAIPNDHRNVARVFRFGRLAYVRHVLIPNAAPSIITGLRLSMGIAWMVIVAVEMLSGSAGIGFFTWNTYNAGNTANVAAAIILIGVTGLALDYALMRLSRLVAIEEVKS